MTSEPELPAALVWARDAPVVTMRATDDPSAMEPFWQETQNRLGRPTRLLPLDAVGLGGGRPSGFIFHMTRCGSTLVGRMLQATERVRVLSEPMALQGLLSHPTGHPEQRQRWLRQLMALYSQTLEPSGQPMVVKWSSGCNRFIPEIQAAFPDTPSVFVHRDPVDVLRSCLERPPLGWRAASSSEFAPHLQPVEGDGFLTRMARYVGSVCHFAVGRGLRPLDYRSLANDVLGGLGKFFELELTSAELESMSEPASRFYSKDREKSMLFDPDEESRRRAGAPHLEPLADRFIRPELARLLAERSSRSG